MSPRISDIPRSRPANFVGLKGSMASIPSPTPMNLMGACVAATAESAPPPLAPPSSLVIIIDPMSVAFWKAAAWTPACWPRVPSMTKTISWGFTLFEISRISLMSPVSSLCLPEVSKRMSSIPFFCISLTPFFASFVASFSPSSPQKGTFDFSASCFNWL